VDSFSFFTAGPLARINVSEKLPDLSILDGANFREGPGPAVISKYETAARDVVLYRGLKFPTYLVCEQGGYIDGIILEVQDPELNQWVDELDKFEASYGLAKEERIFNSKHGLKTAFIYVVKQLSDVKIDVLTRFEQ